MADESGFVVGRILAKLGFAAGDDDQIAKWRRERDQAQRDAAKDIKQNLGAQVDDREFKRYHEQLAKVRAESARKEAYKVKLGADYDERAFREFERDSERARKSTKSFSDELDGLNVKLPKVGSVMGLLKWPAWRRRP
jgi:predicted  nucleic acid-binding Zn-ribbon protein